ncbi:hypothetical protein [Mycolicibacter icosiumassiliensis]|uniref:hypothetical protein n=1 Tax=Mycolicibacter icosiumassiliensis TaxID=1792835 RepID=UPI00082E9099|nr:hypothetical protein [Mycolicibacter icosiumassiliensis]
MGHRKLPLAWAGVVVLGVIVVILVVSWQLFARLFAAQGMVDDLNPAFPVDRVVGARGGIEMVSAATDVGDAMMHSADAAAEVPKLIDFLAEQTGRSSDDTRAMLAKDYPYINGFLTSLPLPEVSAELPKIVHYLGTVLFMTPDQVDHMLETDYPKMYQVIVNLPRLTAGWDDIPGTEKLTRFNGEPVHTMPQLRDYLSQEVIAPVERQQANFRPLGTRGGVAYLAPLLLALGIVVILFGTTMIVETWRGVRPNPLRYAWVVVPVVGAVVILLVLAINAFPRFIGGQQLLDDTRPVFALDRIQGDRAGIEFISIFVEALGPAVLPDGGATEEYPRLLDHVAKEVGVPVGVVRDLVALDFPHAARLLDGVPFSASVADASKLVDYVASTSGVPPAQLWETLHARFPKIYQVLSNLQIVTDGWKEVPGTDKLTRFDGSPARSVPLIRDYFREDVIPGLERQQHNFVVVDTNWPPLFVFAPLLTALGAFVIGYGLWLGVLTRRQLERQNEAQSPVVLVPEEPSLTGSALGDSALADVR